jgi:hypothetical protein
MAQIVRVLKGDPATVAAAIDTLANTEEIQVVQKTFSGGEYLVVSDDSAPASQFALVVRGDPATVASFIQSNTTGPKIVLADTFNNSVYILVGM